MNNENEDNGQRAYNRANNRGTVLMYVDND